MFLSIRTIVCIPQLLHFLEVVGAAIFYYYESEFPRKSLRGNFWYVFFKWNRMVTLSRKNPYLFPQKARNDPKKAVGTFFCT